MLKKINKEYQASEHQLNDVEKNRDKYIGGSDLPYILGNGMKYGKTRIEFAKQKLGIKPNEFKGNEYTRYGQYIEPLVRNYMNDTFGYHFVEDSKIDPLKRYRANCDGIEKEQKILLEVKTFSGKLDIKYYEPQCQFYMEMFDIEECLLVGYDRPEDFYTGIDFALDNEARFFNLDFDETRLVIYKLKRNREMFKKIEIEINKFKYLLDCLKEEEIVNNKVKQVNN